MYSHLHLRDIVRQLELDILKLRSIIITFFIFITVIKILQIKKIYYQNSYFPPLIISNAYLSNKYCFFYIIHIVHQVQKSLIYKSKGKRDLAFHNTCAINVRTMRGTRGRHKFPRCMRITFCSFTIEDHDDNVN